MCLAVPGRIIELKGTMASVNFGGAKKDISVALIDAKQGDYVLVHAGFAIKILDSEDALKNLALINKLGDLMDKNESK